MHICSRPQIGRAIDLLFSLHCVQLVGSYKGQPFLRASRLEDRSRTPFALSIPVFSRRRRAAQRKRIAPKVHRMLFLNDQFFSLNRMSTLASPKVPTAAYKSCRPSKPSNDKPSDSFN
jgi:hypothetical protein